MASQRSTIDFLLEQLADAGAMRAQAMFGEYAVYCDEKTVALVCDDQLFVKPTAAGRAFAPECAEGFPYPGAKPWILIARERWEHCQWLCELIRISYPELPFPKVKTPRKTGPKRRGK
jgi:DNA transformation protein and related proteins